MVCCAGNIAVHGTIAVMPEHKPCDEARMLGQSRAAGSQLCAPPVNGASPVYRARQHQAAGADCLLHCLLHCPADLQEAA
jgi:hypothetical protein